MSFDFQITPQPTETTCGPSSLHAVYRHFGDAASLDQVLREVRQLPDGGTLAVMLGLHALRRGFGATIVTCNLSLFDPSWFTAGRADRQTLRQKLRQQAEVKDDLRLRIATEAYCELLKRGGRVRMQDITPELIHEFTGQGRPVIAGLSATWLYQCARERVTDLQPDDVAGEPTGHFVVLHGVDLATGTIRVADPYKHEPYPGDHYYEAPAQRVIAAIHLGVITADAKLLVLDPPPPPDPETV